jgi:O-antigen/teichoic acid export membrane protein
MVMEFVWPIERALIAGYTKLIAQQQKLRDTVLTTIGCIAALGVPLSVSLAALADPAIKLVLGEKGIPAIPFVQAFAIHGALRSTMSGIFPLFFTLGKPRINTHATFLSVAVRLSALLVLFPVVGVISAPYCLALGTLVSWSYVWFKLNRELELPWHAMPRILMRPLLASGVLLVIGLSITTALPDWPPAAILLLAVPACAAGYVGSSLLLWRMADSPPGPEAIFIGWARRRIAARMARS